MYRTLLPLLCLASLPAITAASVSDESAIHIIELLADDPTQAPSTEVTPSNTTYGDRNGVNPLASGVQSAAYESGTSGPEIFTAAPTAAPLPSDRDEPFPARFPDSTGNFSTGEAQTSSLPSFATYLGCYGDGPNRVLPTLLASNSNPSACTTLAHNAGYTYAGLQYGGQCWAGNAPYNTAGISTGCTMTCTSDSSSNCGGPYANVVYLVNLPTTGPSFATYLGCYVDNAARTLPNQIASGGATVTSCTTTARQLGYTYAGLEYGGQCFGGYYAPNLGTSYTCNMACTDGTNCGGGYSLSTYQISGALPSYATYIGCYADNYDYGNQANRALQVELASTGSTPVLCVTAAHNAGYQYAGVQYGGQCLAGNTNYAKYGTSTGCTTKCTADSTQTCGGSLANQVYSVQSQTTSTATTTAPTSLSTAGPSFSKYLGCYADSATRALPTQIGTTQTITSCVTLAQAKGYAYVGLEYGGECWAGASAPAQGSSTGCTMACTADSTNNCGGGYALSTYQITSAILPSYATYIGCYADGASRLLPNLLTASGSTPAACAALGRAAGYNYIGLQYGGQCYAGNGPYNTYGSATCQTVCSADGTQVCGGNYANSIYQVNTATTTTTTTVTPAPTTKSTTAATASATSPTGCSVSPCYTNLVFDDEFTNGVDSSKWAHAVTMSGCGNGEFEMYVPDTANSYSDSTGALHLHPTYTSDWSYTCASYSSAGGNWFDGCGVDFATMYPNQCTDSGNYGCSRLPQGNHGGNCLNPIRSAKLTSKFSFTYGRMEVRIKVPAGNWLWPAVWLLPTNSANYGGNWPSSGEIDIMETRGNAPGYAPFSRDGIASTLHWGTTSTDFWGNTYAPKTFGVDLSTQFTTFGLYWSPTQLYTYINTDTPANRILDVNFATQLFKQFATTGTATNGYTNPYTSGSNSAPFDKPFYIILNNAVAGTGGFFPTSDSWSNNSPGTAYSDFWNNRAKWQSTWTQPDLVIDWVRVWQ